MHLAKLSSTPLRGNVSCINRTFSTPGSVVCELIPSFILSPFCWLNLPSCLPLLPIIQTIPDRLQMSSQMENQTQLLKISIYKNSQTVHVSATTKPYSGASVTSQAI